MMTIGSQIAELKIPKTCKASTLAKTLNPKVYTQTETRP